MCRTELVRILVPVLQQGVRFVACFGIFVYVETIDGREVGPVVILPESFVPVSVSIKNELHCLHPFLALFNHVPPLIGC